MSKHICFVGAFREEPELGPPLLSGGPNLVPPECVFQNTPVDARISNALYGHHRISECRNQAEPTRSHALMLQNAVSRAMRRSRTGLSQARNHALLFSFNLRGTQGSAKSAPVQAHSGHGGAPEGTPPPPATRRLLTFCFKSVLRTSPSQRVPEPG